MWRNGTVKPQHAKLSVSLGKVGLWVLCLSGSAVSMCLSSRTHAWCHRRCRGYVGRSSDGNRRRHRLVTGKYFTGDNVGNTSCACNDGYGQQRSVRQVDTGAVSCLHPSLCRARCDSCCHTTVELVVRSGELSSIVAAHLLVGLVVQYDSPSGRARPMVRIPSTSLWHHTSAFCFCPMLQSWQHSRKDRCFGWLHFLSSQLPPAVLSSCSLRDQGWRRASWAIGPSTKQVARPC